MLFYAYFFEGISEGLPGADLRSLIRVQNVKNGGMTADISHATTGGNIAVSIIPLTYPRA